MAQQLDPEVYDLAIVGSGVAGLTAAVQAVELGLKVILIESSRRAGGNWDVTYGMTAVESPISKALDIHVDARALMNQEIRFFNYQVDARLWAELMATSGENVAWLMGNGVVFEEELEPYTAGEINAPVFHRWKKGVSPSRKMLEQFEKKGGTLLIHAKARRLLMKEGRISSVMVERESGDLLEIRCKAAISAGGGYTKNRRLVGSLIGIEDYAARSIAENDGSAIEMCVEAGARSLVNHGAFVIDAIPRQMKIVNHWLTYIHSRPGSWPFHICVNQDGERYTDESSTLKLYAFSPAAAFTQEKTYTIYDEEKIQKLEELNGNGIYRILTEAAKKNAEGIVRADSFEELAEKLGIPAEAFSETMKTYNASCEMGMDSNFEKTPEFLQGFKPPFYGWENGFQVCATLEGVDYSINMEALDNRRKVIPGLYIAGTDGAKLWRDYYSLAIPGSCNCNNVYSGRKAAKSAAAYINTLSL